MRFTTLLIVLSFTISGYTQQTVGVFQYDSLSFEGYSLFAPSAFSATYLIDNCGRRVNTWPAPSTPGLSVYLLENGQLLRTNRIFSTTFLGGGAGGRLERQDWDGTVIWQYEYATDTYQQHHDVEYLPNGNILLLCWDYITRAEAIALGRDSSLIGPGIWSEKIVEIEPFGFNQANLIWEWRMIDHIIQDFDSTRPNYGVVADHPEKFDLNWVIDPAGSFFTDWVHANSVSYNSELDQIVFSSHNWSEIWIIDHSTTTAEAAGSSGGNSGKGGDILYRYGNPITYKRGTLADQKFFQQHDPHWLSSGTDSGKIMVFNNGVGRPSGKISSVDILSPPVDGDGNYIVPSSDPFGPADFDFSWMADPPTDFYSKNVGGAQELPNGNLLICEGAEGRLFEADRTGQIHWEYEVPVGLAGPIGQGVPAVNNQVFRVIRYAPDYPGLAGQDLTPGNVIEINPFDTSCTISSGPATGIEFLPEPQIHVFPNPFMDEIWLHSTVSDPPVLFNLQGQKMTTAVQSGDAWHFNTAFLPAGIYFISQGAATIKILKL